MSCFLCTVLTCVAVRQCIKVQKWIMEEMDIRRELLGCWWSQSLCSVNMFLTVVKGNAGGVHILVQSFSHEYRGKKSILCFWIILKEKGAAKEGLVLQWQTGKTWTNQQHLSGSFLWEKAEVCNGSEVVFSHCCCDTDQKAEVVLGCRAGRIAHKMHKVITVWCFQGGCGLTSGSQERIGVSTQSSRKQLWGSTRRTWGCLTQRRLKENMISTFEYLKYLKFPCRSKGVHLFSYPL